MNLIRLQLLSGEDDVLVGCYYDDCSSEVAFPIDSEQCIRMGHALQATVTYLDGCSQARNKIPLTVTSLDRVGLLAS